MEGREDVDGHENVLGRPLSGIRSLPPPRPVIIHKSDIWPLLTAGEPRNAG